MDILAVLEIIEVNREHMVPVINRAAIHDRLAVNFDCNIQSAIALTDLVVFGRHGLRQFILKGVLIGTICIDIARNGANELIFNVLANRGVGAQVGRSENIAATKRPLIILIVVDCLVDGGNTGLLGNGHGTAADNSENRRGAGIRLFSRIIRFADTAAVGQKEIVPRFTERKRLVRWKRFSRKINWFSRINFLLNYLGERIEQIILADDGPIVGKNRNCPPANLRHPARWDYP